VCEEAPESPQSPGPSEAPPEVADERETPSERVQKTQEERRWWFRRFFGFV
jgi:hypothetical protein